MRSSASSKVRATAPSSRRWGRRRPSCSPPCASATARCGPTRRCSSARSRRAPTAPASSRCRSWRRCIPPWASGLGRKKHRPSRGTPATSRPTSGARAKELPCNADHKEYEGVGSPARPPPSDRAARRAGVDGLGDGRRPAPLTEAASNGIAPRRAPPPGPRLLSPAMAIAALDLDLEVFNGPFDLLLTLVLKEEIDLLEVDLAEVVLAYVEHLERAGDLDLEAATEFLVLIAALLELKSRLMLPAEDEEGLDIEPVEAAEELLARMLEYHRYRQVAEHLRERLEAEHGYRYRSAPLPPELRRISIDAAEAAYDPERLAEALGGLLNVPPPLDLRHVRRPAVSVEQRLRHLRDLLASRSRFSFDDAVQGADRLTEAVTLFALLELYKAGEAKWEQEVPFRPITVVPPG